MGRHQPQPRLTIAPSDVTFATISQQPYVRPGLKDSVAQATVLFIPQEGHGPDTAPCFPEGTSTLYLTLRDALPPGTHLECALADEDYVELGLHEALLAIATIAITAVLLPLTIHLVGTWLADKLLKRSDKVKATFIAIDVKSGSSIEYQYEGPADAFEATLLAALPSPPHQDSLS